MADCRQSLADAGMLHGIGQCCSLGRPRGLHLSHSSASGTASLGSLCCFGVVCLLYYRVCRLILTLTCVFGCYSLVYWFAFYLLMCLYTFVLLHTCVFVYFLLICVFVYLCLFTVYSCLCPSCLVACRMAPATDYSTMLLWDVILQGPLRSILPHLRSHKICTML